MTVTDVYAAGGLGLGGSADVDFVHGAQVDSDIEVLWDFGQGLEDVTSFLYEAESFTGRDWPSQLQGKAGPGRLQLRLRNDDDRFSYFNTGSPLNQGGRTLDPGARIRIQTTGTTGVDPVLLVRDRFDGTGVITTDELGTPWEHQPSTSQFVRLDGVAGQFSGGGTESLMVIDVGAADYYVQVTIAELGDNVVETAGLQEHNELRLVYRWQDDQNYSYLAYGPFFDGIQVHVIEAVDVVAGAPTTIYGPFSEVGSGSGDAAGDHRRRVTIGVHVAGSAVHFYINGCRDTFTPETGLQLDETHVGIYAYYGVGNRSPAVDEIAVWDTIPADTEGVLWTGDVVDVVPEAPAPKSPKSVTVTAEGTLAQLAGSDIRPQAWAGRAQTGIAMGEAIQRAGLLYPPGVLARGAHTAGSSADTEINALTHCRKLEEVEAGFLHEAPEGWLVYRSRTYRDALTTVATFSDAPGAQFSYDSFELLQWRREIINKVSAGVSYGAPDIQLILGGKAGTASGVQNSVDINLPASINDGDLLVVIIVSTIDSNTEQWLVPLFWVRERDTGASVSRRTQVYTHICAASDASDNVVFYNDVTSAGGSFVWVAYQFRNWYGSHEGIHIGEWAVGESFAGADPEAILPPWGDVNPTAFVAQRGGTSTGGAGSITNPTYPLGYFSTSSDFQDGVSGNGDDCGRQACSKLAMTAIEDPSTFTGFAGLNNAETSVIAVRGRNGSPPEPRGRLRVEANDVDSQRRHNVVASYDGCDLFPDEDAAETWCQLMLTRYAQVRPIVRFSFTATISGAYRAQAYKRRLGDKVRVVATEGTGMGIDADFHIESIRHKWTNAGKLWTVTWELSPA